ncbi:pirin family protein [Portibacter marinus]|uniref:pirin family protein n=1 Tax=Portibacter marinus TaxID=2898660 RepID=UPI001F488D86|nr:pirin family protein [Portibacter marinus]
MSSNDKLVIEERSRSIGNFMVGRLLPFRKKRQVGPFTFVDHMGPIDLGNDRWIDVDQHPHIGLCTFTYLFEGEIEHKDSTGAVQIIRSGDVGLMTSGKGVTHTERTPAASRNKKNQRLHGYQIWIALPIDKEEIEPRFDFIRSEKLPTWKHNDLSIKLLAGKAFGRESSLPISSDLFVLHIEADDDNSFEINGELKGEIGFLVNKGKIIEDGEEITEGQLMISKTEDTCSVALNKGTRLLVFGGKALEEPRYLYWNFVSSSRERLERAKEDWKARRFPKVKGDDTYIPLPS